MQCNSGASECCYTSNKLLTDIGDVVRTCSVSKSSPDQYAAVDSSIEHMDLPYILSDSMMSQNVANPTFCVKYSVSLLCTLLAVVSSYSEIRNVVLLVNDMRDVRSVVSAVDMARNGSNAGVTCAIARDKQAKKATYDVVFSSLNEKMKLSEKRTMSIMKQLMSEPMTLAWYESDGFLQFTTYLQTSRECMWVNATGTAGDSVSIAGEDGSMLLPVFYTNPRESSLVSLNFGPGRPVVASDKGTLVARVNTVVNDLLNSKTKKKKCYYCTYMARVHESMCSNSLNEERKDTYQINYNDFILNIING